MTVFSVEVPTWKVEPVFVLGCSHERLARYLSSRYRVVLPDGDGSEDGLAGRMYSFTGPPWRLVWTRERDIGVMLHETFHLVTRICADKGVVIRAHNERGENDDEAAAYLFEFIARAALRRCRTWKH